MNIRIAAAKALSSVGRDGMTATMRKVFWYARGRKFALDPFDIVHGTDTSAELPPWELRAASASERFANKYQASPPNALTEAVAFANVEPSSLTFIDLGCGKGRTLIVATHLGFNRVIGVEFSPLLVGIANENLHKLGITNAEVICLDATRYLFQDEDLVLYMYNPFQTDVMRHVIENLRAVKEHKLLVIYIRPLCAEMLDGCGFLTRLGSPPGNDDLVVWKTPRGRDPFTSN